MKRGYIYTVIETTEIEKEFLINLNNELNKLIEMLKEVKVKKKIINKIDDVGITIDLILNNEPIGIEE